MEGTVIIQVGINSPWYPIAYTKRRPGFPPYEMWLYWLYRLEVPAPQTDEEMLDEVRAALA